MSLYPIGFSCCSCCSGAVAAVAAVIAEPVKTKRSSSGGVNAVSRLSIGKVVEEEKVVMASKRRRVEEK